MIKKDYIVHPKDTGYRSLHIVFIIEIYVDDEIKKVPVEIRENFNKWLLMKRLQNEVQNELQKQHFVKCVICLVIIILGMIIIHFTD